MKYYVFYTLYLNGEKGKKRRFSGSLQFITICLPPNKQHHISSSSLQMKSAEAGMTLDRGGNMQASTELLLAANGDITPTNHNGTNGSIITMTLKNNHLIVETEERNVSKVEVLRGTNSC